MSRRPVLQIAVPSPVYRTFDYLAPAGVDPADLCLGIRVRVPFRRARAVGILVGCSAHSRVDRGRLRPALEVLDREPLFDESLLALLGWAADYYRHPPGEVFATALPVALRRGAPARGVPARRWRLTETGRGRDPGEPRRAPRQTRILTLLDERVEGVEEKPIRALGGDWRGALRALAAKGWIGAHEEPAVVPACEPGAASTAPTLNGAQRDAVQAVCGALGRFQAFLLDGVTGSGKTEVYLRIVQAALQAGRQTLVLVPEIGLTPQLVARFRRRLQAPVAVLHSGLSERERLTAWLAARSGAAPVIIGTRSAVFTPLAAPGVVIVDEEHDASFKQQEGFRYHGRDLAVLRARRLGVPIVLGSATPSLESLHNAAHGRYRRLVLPERVGNAVPPRMGVLDLRRRSMDEGLSGELLRRIGGHLQEGGQVLLFLNRRGYAPTVICHECGWVAECPRCDAHMTLHLARRRVRCHHCGAERPLPQQCPTCGGEDLRALGQGTERMEQALERHFPGVEIARIDRDSTRRKGAMESLLDGARTGRSRILIGTQMLAKGHHFPGVTLVGVLDGDQGLYGADFRAGERMAQLIVQVAGRAGRAERPGEVLVQTHHPDHPLLTALLRGGYAGFAAQALDERRAAELPPYTRLALLRAEAPAPEAPLAFLEAARASALHLGDGAVAVLGPVPAPMERRAGRYRAQLLLQSAGHAALQRLLGAWVPALEGLKSARRVRWSVDVDPADTL